MVACPPFWTFRRGVGVDEQRRGRRVRPARYPSWMPAGVGTDQTSASRFRRRRAARRGLAGVRRCRDRAGLERPAGTPEDIVTDSDPQRLPAARRTKALPESSPPWLAPERRSSGAGSAPPRGFPHQPPSSPPLTEAGAVAQVARAHSTCTTDTTVVVAGDTSVCAKWACLLAKWAAWPPVAPRA
jgi:hypothetical protein